MSLKLFSLDGRTALVTGSARGLGFAIARGLAEAGARGHPQRHQCRRNQSGRREAGSRRPCRARARFRRHRRCGGPGRLWKPRCPGPVAWTSWSTMPASSSASRMVDLDPADWRRVIETNLTSAFLIGREAAKRMIARQSGGKIINIASLTSEVARATVAPYTAAKGRDQTSTRSMAAEWAEYGIQANAIGPGYMATDMNQALMDDAKFDAWVKSRTPARRWGQPEELVGAAVFLASPGVELRERAGDLCRRRNARGPLNLIPSVTTKST